MNNIKIKKIRKELGLTQEEFAKKLGLHYRTIQKWESGETKIRRANTFLIEELYKKHTKGVDKNKFENKNGNKLIELPDESLMIQVPLVPFSTYASFIEVYEDEHQVNEKFETTYFTVDKISKGNYIAFTVKNDSMNGGKLFDTPSGAQVLTRELEKQRWRNDFNSTQYGWVIICQTGIFHKDIKGPDENGNIICISRNKSPEFPEFPLSLNDVHSIYKVIKRTF
ncbi:helix-turn-helix transcriptional regulator [Tenacibaculum maritimum]|uniref:helix-turn-helix domain-containing protein n=1 Tax=Tenacibaculum maritimum TaxID=107401 RepID=UPI0038776198